MNSAWWGLVAFSLGAIVMALTMTAWALAGKP